MPATSDGDARISVEDDIPTEIAEIPFPPAQLPEFCLLQAEKGKVKQPFARSSCCNGFVTTP